MILKLDTVAAENLAKVITLIDNQGAMKFRDRRGVAIILKSTQDDGHGCYNIVLSVEELTMTDDGDEPCVPMSVLRDLFEALERFPEDPYKYGS